MAVREFDSFEGMAMHLLLAKGVTAAALHLAVKDAVKIVKEDAQQQIGHYQDAVQAQRGDIGVFPAWAPLADSTEREKERLGYPLDAPLLRDGEMRESIDGEAMGLKGIVGSKDEKMMYHELGTERMPPRPVLGPAAAKHEEEIQRLMLEALAGALIFADETHIPISVK